MDEQHLPVKPRLRGHLHQWAFVVSLVAGLALVLLAPTGRSRFAATVYAASASLLFGTSALYHRRTWATRTRRLMQRLDHAMILVLIAGSYTPVAMLVLAPSTGRWMLWAVWGGAAVGVAMRLFWSGPRWMALPPYLLVGCVALLALPQLLERGGVAPLVLLVGGGATYVVGAVIYATRRPDPRPAVFGYHELFHLLTLVAGAALYVVNAMAVSRA